VKVVFASVENQQLEERGSTFETPLVGG